MYSMRAVGRGGHHQLIREFFLLEADVSAGTDHPLVVHNSGTFEIEDESAVFPGDSPAQDLHSSALLCACQLKAAAPLVDQESRFPEHRRAFIPTSGTKPCLLLVVEDGILAIHPPHQFLDVLCGFDGRILGPASTFPHTNEEGQISDGEHISHGLFG